MSAGPDHTISYSGQSVDVPESVKMIENYIQGLNSSYIVVERSTTSQANISENYKSVFAKFGDLKIQTGKDMINQHNGWYLGMAFPYTLTRAVGGYDPPNQPRWRRPETRDLPTPRLLLQTWLTPAVGIATHKLPKNHYAMGPATKVKLSDITRGLPQRIEGQFRRTWAFAPALWNLYFRERVNLGAGLSVKQGQKMHEARGINVETEPMADVA